VVLNLLILLTIEVLAAKWVNLLIHRRKHMGALEPKFLRCETHQAGLPGLYNSSTHFFKLYCTLHCQFPSLLLIKEEVHITFFSPSGY
jgi:hypothetical protein